MKDIKTLANDLNISKESIYKKLNFSMKEELKDCKLKKDGKTYINEVGESIILQSLRREKEEIENLKEHVPTNEEKIQDCNSVRNDFVITNELQNYEYIQFLKEQIKEKDIQIGKLLELEIISY